VLRETLLVSILENSSSHRMSQVQLSSTAAASAGSEPYLQSHQHAGAARDAPQGCGTTEKHLRFLTWNLYMERWRSRKASRMSTCHSQGP